MAILSEKPRKPCCLCAFSKLRKTMTRAKIPWDLQGKLKADYCAALAMVRRSNILETAYLCPFTVMMRIASA